MGYTVVRMAGAAGQAVIVCAGAVRHTAVGQRGRRNRPKVPVIASASGWHICRSSRVRGFHRSGGGVHREVQLRGSMLSGTCDVGLFLHRNARLSTIQGQWYRC